MPDHRLGDIVPGEPGCLELAHTGGRSSAAIFAVSVNMVLMSYWACMNLRGLFIKIASSPVPTSIGATFREPISTETALIAVPQTALSAPRPLERSGAPRLGRAVV